MCKDLNMLKINRKKVIVKNKTQIDIVTDVEKIMYQEQFIRE